MKVFIDTNVILDMLLDRTEFVRAATDIFQMGIEKSIELYATPLTFATCHYILRKEVGKEKAQEALCAIKAIVTTAYMDDTQLTNALHGNMPDFEDMLQYESAIANACDIIVTRNGKHFPKDRIPIMTPSQFLSQYTNN